MFEQDIFSIDKNGNIIVTIELVNEYSETNELIQEYIESLPNISDIERIYKGDGIFDDWDDYAKKGITSYDNYDKKNILITKALNTLNIKSLPLNIQKYF